MSGRQLDHDEGVANTTDPRNAQQGLMTNIWSQYCNWVIIIRRWDPAQQSLHCSFIRRNSASRPKCMLHCKSRRSSFGLPTPSTKVPPTLVQPCMLLRGRAEPFTNPRLISFGIRKRALDQFWAVFPLWRYIHQSLTGWYPFREGNWWGHFVSMKIFPLFCIRYLILLILRESKFLKTIG